MKYIIYLFLVCACAQAHKVNLFINNENENIEIYSYFGNSKPCNNCTLLIKNNDEIILQDRLNIDGKYSYKSKFENIEIIIDAGSGHIAKEKLNIKLNHNENLNSHIQNENKSFYIKVLFSLVFILIFFYILKRFKK